MEDIFRISGLFPIARVVAMKTKEKEIFPWDSPMIYSEIQITIEDFYGIKKKYIIEMVAMYRH